MVRNARAKRWKRLRLLSSKLCTDQTVTCTQRLVCKPPALADRTSGGRPAGIEAEESTLQFVKLELDKVLNSNGQCKIRNIGDCLGAISNRMCCSSGLHSCIAFLELIGQVEWPSLYALAR